MKLSKFIDNYGHKRGQSGKNDRNTGYKLS
ncbi:MAG: hypothetical protein ACI9WC_003604 [Arenicella sp.]|jgi:hypothetical protein